ncbi:MAG: hydrolase [Candidatus Binatia bacterium]|nr:MAG: hydrolase [Candidatus Binatia bacterium]
MRVLWAPWRMAYVGGPKDPRCIFCLGADFDPRAELVLYEDPASVVLLNRYPYASVHLMVAPRSHVGDPCALDAGAFRAVTDLVRDTIGILREEYGPDGFNVGLNLGRAAGAGFEDHFHWHVVPRWHGDTNFMPLLADVRVLPEHLERTYDRLRPRFESRKVRSA